MLFDLRGSLRAKLVTLVAGLLLAISIFIALFFPARLERIARFGVESRATGMATVLAVAIAPGLEFDDASNVKSLLDQLSSVDGVAYAAVRRGDGAIFAAFHEELLTDLGVPVSQLSDGRPQVVIRGDLLHVLMLVRARAGAIGILVIGFSVAELEQEKHDNRVVVGLVAAVVLGLGLLATFIFGSYFVRPIRRMTEIADRIARGDLSQRTLELRGRDEVGQMADAFDRMIESLGQLASAADKVAAGDLGGRLEMEGPVAAAFNRMIEAQRVVVGEIAAAAEQLGRAAAAMAAASQEHEAAALETARGVDEVSRTMESLLEGASNIAESAGGVLNNAERTRQTTDLTAAKIAELSGHTNRIGEILEVIRDIADRSDLLALNASIEGSRAGEQGRTFSLVAAEMRRLAERVTASVQDVKALVSDIRASGSSTVLATEEGRRLAESTTESARTITMVTQQQRTGTEQVSESMLGIAAILSQSVEATRNNRTLAEDLKQQADRLAVVVGQFRVTPE